MANQIMEEAPVNDVPDILLEESPSILSDLFRQAAGYKVRGMYLPDLTNPERLHITVLDSENKVIDTFVRDANASNRFGLDVFEHTVRYSEKLAEFINKS